MFLNLIKELLVNLQCSFDLILASDKIGFLFHWQSDIHAPVLTNHTRELFTSFWALKENKTKNIILICHPKPV